MSGICCGTVFALKRNGSSYAERILHRFQLSRQQDGNEPVGALLEQKHALYSVTFVGGIFKGTTSSGYGTVYKVEL